MTGAEERELESSRVATWLRDSILDGERPPGSKLTERDLATEFGVSRVPVRDALKLLDGEGLVELRPRTWAIVREFTAADLADLDEVREVLEPMAFRLAAERHRREDLQRLKDVLDAEQASARLEDSVTSRRAAADFHEVAVQLADNRLLGDLMGSIRSRLRWSLVQHDDLEHIADEHVALYEAVRDRDGDRASALARAHVESSRQERLAHAVSLRPVASRAAAT
ncbi:DNA-binding GntR family transcriptional regulator [Microbacterium sp. W4I4]|uniref:GntR family transcriptional regulator n=1 Tax=Microbacterium sp. W4I4 TaxID=3042295 RepID=UPI00277F6022|nr:GntR family transcriptional regulator [Microbacterium sp. W4I4]MDQ0613265.1 DNA-binding GntR family transcriptional regulator [Microbacterium sp. W4I4]